MRIDTLLRDEVANELEELGKLEVGSEKYKTTVDSLVKLIGQAHELDKFDAELQEKIDARIAETEIKQQAAKDDKINRVITHAINVLGIVVPVVLTVWGTRTSLRFEETGTVTTTMGRGFLQRLLPKMK